MNDALTTLGSATLAGSGPIDDHRSDAIVTAAWLRRASDDPALWSPAPLAARPEIARLEGWTFGVA